MAAPDALAMPGATGTVASPAWGVLTSMAVAGAAAEAASEAVVMTTSPGCVEAAALEGLVLLTGGMATSPGCVEAAVAEALVSPA